MGAGTASCLRRFFFRRVFISSEARMCQLCAVRKSDRPVKPSRALEWARADDSQWLFLSTKALIVRECCQLRCRHLDHGGFFRAIPLQVVDGAQHDPKGPHLECDGLRL